MRLRGLSGRERFAGGLGDGGFVAAELGLFLGVGGRRVLGRVCKLLARAGGSCGGRKGMRRRGFGVAGWWVGRLRF